MQVPFKVDSGKAPRKVEIERRKRQYTEQAGQLDRLLQTEGIHFASFQFVNMVTSVYI